MKYELIRSERRTVEIKVDIDERIIVRAPLGVSDKYIEDFIVSKADWIDKACEKMRIKRQNMPQADYSFIRFLGKKYPVTIDTKTKKLYFNGKKFLMPDGKNEEEIRKLISAWYKKQARRIYEQRLQELSEATGTKYSKLRISGARTRWGSCTQDGVISISWKLIMAEGRAIDYVILHELAHTIQMNHSDEFWDIVEGWLPGYKDVKEYLKDFSFQVAREGWNN